jgi:hypothetical protein
VKALLATGLGAAAIALPSTGSAQAPPACTQEQGADVHLTTRDRFDGGRDKPLYATHQVLLSAQVPAGAGNVQLSPAPGVKVLQPGANGRKLDVVVPAPPSFRVTASWEQPASSLPGDTARCSASTTLSLPVLAARSPAIHLRAKRQPRSTKHNVTFDVTSARTGANLDPIELTLRRSSRAELPSSRSRALRWSVPMRPGERRRYSKKIPALSPFLSFRLACRYWYFSCGAVWSRVETRAALGCCLQSLSFAQPSRWAAPFGILVATDMIGRSPRRFGFDIQARQAGRLLARYRRAGECRDAPGTLGGVVQDCTIVAVENFPR